MPDTPSGAVGRSTLVITAPRLPGLVTAMVAGLFALAGTGFLVGAAVTDVLPPALIALGAVLVAPVGLVAILGARRMLAPRVYFEAGPGGLVPHGAQQALDALSPGAS